MNTVEEWAVKIADEVAPAETDLAPIWATAFVAGGKERQELFLQTNSQVGGFLPGDLMPVLPTVFKALAFAGPSILALLTSDVTGKFLDCVKNALSVGEVLGRTRKWFSAETAPTGDEKAYDRLNEIMSQLDKQLRPLGLKQFQTDRISLIVLLLLLEHPPEAKQFIGKLTEKK